MLNAGVLPVVPSKGSVGACGDLAPLAHLTAVLMGEGEAFYQGRRTPGGEALRAAGIEPVVLEAKEGLALINGTQMMTAVGALTLWEAENISKAADIAAAQAVEALRGTNTPYLEISHRVRPHAGPGGDRPQPDSPARKQRDPCLPCHLQQGAGRLFAPLRSAGARGGEGRARVRARRPRSRD